MCTSGRSLCNHKAEIVKLSVPFAPVTSWRCAFAKRPSLFARSCYNNRTGTVQGARLVAVTKLVGLCSSSVIGLCSSSVIGLCSSSVIGLCSSSVIGLCSSSVIGLCSSSVIGLCSSSVIGLCSSSVSRITYYNKAMTTIQTRRRTCDNM